MSLTDYINIKNKLEDVYYDPNNDDCVLAAMPTEKEFNETLNFFANLCRHDEVIQEYIMDDDIVSLYRYLNLYHYSFNNKYGNFGELLREKCKSKDCTSIEVWFHSLYENIMSTSIDDPEFDTNNRDFCGKFNIIIDFYTKILNHDFRNVFGYANTCEYLNNLCLLLDKYLNKEKCNKK